MNKKKANPSKHSKQLNGGEAWYYETLSGIEIYQHGYAAVEGGGVRHHHAIRIPWNMLMKSAKRCGKA